jgi:hypothetical protein
MCFYQTLQIKRKKIIYPKGQAIKLSKIKWWDFSSTLTHSSSDLPSERIATNFHLPLLTRYTSRGILSAAPSRQSRA